MGIDWNAIAAKSVQTFGLAASVNSEAERLQLIALAGRGMYGTAFTWGRHRIRPQLKPLGTAPLVVWRDPFRGAARDSRLVWNWKCVLPCWAEGVAGWGLKSAEVAREVALEHLAYWHYPASWWACTYRDCGRPHAQWGKDPAGILPYPTVSRGHVQTWGSLTPAQATERAQSASTRG